MAPPVRILACATVLCLGTLTADACVNERHPSQTSGDAVASNLTGCHRLLFQWSEGTPSEPWKGTLTQWFGPTPQIAVGLWDSPNGTRGLVWLTGRRDERFFLDSILSPAGELRLTVPDSADLVLFSNGLHATVVRLGAVNDVISGRLYRLSMDMGNSEHEFPGSVQAVPSECDDRARALTYSQYLEVPSSGPRIEEEHGGRPLIRPERPHEAAAFQARRDSLNRARNVR